MITIKFLREWHGHKQGEVVEFGAGAARELMRRKIAVATSSKNRKVERAVVEPMAETATVDPAPMKRGPGRPRKGEW